MLKVALFVLCLVVVTAAYPFGYSQYWGWGGWPYQQYSPYYGGYWDPYYYQPQRHYDNGRLIFYGEFHGSCKGAADGLYYVDKRSFAFCSNGQKTIQPCAEGSANPPLTNFQKGQYYGIIDFCSINLVARGYNDYKAYVVPHDYPKEDAYAVPHDYPKEDAYAEHSYGGGH